MGDSPCLLRSFSHPCTAVRESKEGDPLRALTESISFGRFMSESLAWEKWSTFSSNRYLEEVEQFSKPGSVAQKKAYFEAHYKKRAAMKAATLVDHGSTSVNCVPEAEDAEDSQNDASAQPFSIIGNGDVDMDELLENEAAETEPTCSANMMSSGLDEKAHSSTTMTDQKGEIESSIQMEISSHLGNDEGCEKVVSIPEEKVLAKDSNSKDNGGLSNNKRQINSPSKAAYQSRAPKIQRSSSTKASSTQPKTGGNAVTNAKRALGELFNKKKLTPKSIHMSINFSNSGNDSKDHLMPKDISSKAQNTMKKSILGGPKLRQPMSRESADRRTNSVVNTSVSGRVLQAASSETSKMSGSKSRLSIVSSPFSFRSEERAAKRKEFFQKLEEKNGKQKEMMHQKDKAEHGFAKLRQSFRTKLSEGPCQGLQSPKNQIKKIPLTRPRSPKLGRKPAPSAVQENSTRLPQRPTTNSESSKNNITVKSSRSMTRPVTQLPKKKVHENASPNIQR